MKNYSKTQKGITLVSLIITVIVLMILAAVTINAVKGEGVLSRAEQSREETELKLEEKDFKTIVLKYQTGEISENDLDDKLEEYGFKEVSEGRYISKSGNNFYISSDGNAEYIETIEQLQERHKDKIKYYETFSEAVTDVNNSKIGENAISDIESATVAVYEDNGEKYVLLLKDVTLTDYITVSANITINLGGNTINFTKRAIDTVTKDSSNTIKIDGRLKGSTISGTGTGTTTVIGIAVRSGNNIVVDGVTFISNSSEGSAYCINMAESTTVTSSVTVSNCKFIASSTGDGTTKAAMGINISKKGKAIVSNCTFESLAKGNMPSYGILARENTELIVTNCDIISEARNYSYSYGIRTETSSNARINNSDIKSYCNSTANSFGIYNNGGTVSLKDCNITGVCSGI